MNRKSRSRNGDANPSRRLLLERLERRDLLVAVDSIFDGSDFDPGDGACDIEPDPDAVICTLRAAIEHLNASGASGAITFDIEQPDPPQPPVIPTLHVGRPLPAIRVGVTIDGTSQPGTGRVELTGSLTPTVHALVLEGGASTVQGMVINGFGGHGILILFKDSNVITNNYIGTDTTGTERRENGGYGVVIGAGSNEENNGANSNVITGNVISGNREGGIIIGGVGIDNRTHDRITNNKIGTDISGTVGLGNGGHGITIQSNVLDIGISNNVIADNDGDGIRISDEVREITIRGNRIGTNRDGSEALGNGGHGISVQLSPGFPIGGTSAAQRNIISANGGHGIWLEFSPDIVIEGNHIGVDETGTRDLGNGANGVYAFQSSRTQIGGSEAGAGNVISGNGLNGVLLDNATAESRVQGNRIGTSADGTIAIPNLLDGVALANFPSGNQIGGTGEGQRNIIAGNGLAGVSIRGPNGLGNDANVIQGNFIGTDATGAVALGNLEGVVIESRFPQIVGGLRLGPDCNFACNVISGNLANGVRISQSADTRVWGNFIGVDVTGKAPVGNGRGALINAGSTDVRLGDINENLQNVISGNRAEGVLISDPLTHAVEVLGNFIGTDLTGIVTNPDAVAASGDELGNRAGGIAVRGARETRIGGTQSLGEDCEALCNVIAGNGASGILITDGASETTVAGNFIGTDRTGTESRGNADYGIAIIDAPRNRIGGTSADQGNLILANELAGIYIHGGPATENIVAGNAIGQPPGNPTGIIPSLANGAGVLIEDASNNRIGGAVGTVTDGRCLGACNTISGNVSAGVAILGNASAGNRIERNSIYSNGALGIDLGNNGVTPNDHLRNQPADADLGPNQLMNFPVGIIAYHTAAETMISGLLDTELPELAEIDIYANSSIDDTRFGEGRLYVGSATPTETGNFLIVLADPIPAGFPYLSAAATDDDGNTSEFSPVCRDTNGDGDPDSDGDGLCDDWETHGIDFNGDGTLDLPAGIDFQANPIHKNLFVEVDYMQQVGAHTHRPDSQALDDVAFAFLNAPVPNPDDWDGIDLQTVVDESLPELSSLIFIGRGPGQADDFLDLKLGNNPGSLDPACGVGQNDGHFGRRADRMSENCHNVLGARRLAFRYAIYGHSHAHELGSSGIAELPGNDFMVTFGGWNAAAIQAGGGRQTAEAAAYMHELGHNLGLHHGGDDDINCKPNYISVMNYTLTFPNFVSDRVLSYSPRALPTIDEGNLDERVGIGDPRPRTTVFNRGGVAVLADASAPVMNWNGDSDATDFGFAQDLTRVSSQKCGDGPTDLLNGHDDWKNLRYHLGISADFADTGAATAGVEIDVTADDVIAGAMSIDFDADGLSNFSDNCPAIPNPDQIDTDGNGRGDACEPSPPLVGDLNRDGVVDRGDVAILTRRLGRLAALPLHGDLDGDADVDLNDLAILQSHLTPVISPAPDAIVVQAALHPAVPTTLTITARRSRLPDRPDLLTARRKTLSPARIDAALAEGARQPANEPTTLRASRQPLRRAPLGPRIDVFGVPLP